MSALLFVHGTGVRQPEYGKTLDLLRAGVERLAQGAQVHDCYWGDAFGVPPGSAAERCRESPRPPNWTPPPSRT